MLLYVCTIIINKHLYFMKKFFAWLILSSRDPKKVSLTIKAYLTATTTYILFFAGLFHISLGASDLAVLIDQIVKIISDILIVISAATTFWALLRKVMATIQGTNKVINTGATL